MLAPPYTLHWQAPFSYLRSATLLVRALLTLCDGRCWRPRMLCTGACSSGGYSRISTTRHTRRKARGAVTISDSYCRTAHRISPTCNTLTLTNDDSTAAMTSVDDKAVGSTQLFFLRSWSTLRTKEGIALIISWKWGHIVSNMKSLVSNMNIIVEMLSDHNDIIFVVINW